MTNLITNLRTLDTLDDRREVRFAAIRLWHVAGR
jgi:hypothetical protein